MKRAILGSFFYIVAQGIAYGQDVILDWADNSNNENGFVVQRTLSLNCLDGWEVIGYTGIDQNSFRESIRIPGACYRVAAYNEAGLSAYSNIVQVPQPPGGYTSTTVQDYLGMPADYTIEPTGANPTSSSSPQKVSSSGPARGLGTKPPKPSLPNAIAGDRVPIQAKLNPMAQQSENPKKTWSVQVSAVATKKIADNLAQQLQSEGYTVYVVQTKVKGQTYHRVRIGPFSARKQAEPVRDALTRHQSYRDAYLAID